MVVGRVHPVWRNYTPVHLGGAGAGDGFPNWETADDTDGAGNGSNFTAVYPANCEVGDIVVLIVGTTSSSEVTTPATSPNVFSSFGGFTLNFQRIRWYWRRIDGTEDAQFTVAMSLTAYRTWRMIRISGCSATTSPETVSGNGGTDDSPDPGSITPSWGEAKTLFLVPCCFNGAVSLSSYPANYSGVLSGTTEVLAVAARKNEVETEDPGVFTLSGNDAWVVDTAAFPPVGS